MVRASVALTVGEDFLRRENPFNRHLPLKASPVDRMELSELIEKLQAIQSELDRYETLRGYAQLEGELDKVMDIVTAEVARVPETAGRDPDMQEPPSLLDLCSDLVARTFLLPWEVVPPGGDGSKLIADGVLNEDVLGLLREARKRLVRPVVVRKGRNLRDLLRVLLHQGFRLRVSGREWAQDTQTIPVREAYQVRVHSKPFFPTAGVGGYATLDSLGGEPQWKTETRVVDKEVTRVKRGGSDEYLDVEAFLSRAKLAPDPIFAAIVMQEEVPGLADVDAQRRLEALVK